MSTKASTRSIKRYLWHAIAVVIGVAVVVAFAYFVLPQITSVSYNASVATATTTAPTVPELNIADYDARLLALAHVATSSPWYYAFLQGTTTVMLPGATTTTYVKPELWPASAALPNDGRAILPFSRIVAYYGNFYSTGMGVLGQYPEAQVLQMLASTSAQWAAADPSTPVV